MPLLKLLKRRTHAPAQLLMRERGGLGRMGGGALCVLPTAQPAILALLLLLHASRTLQTRRVHFNMLRRVATAYIYI